MKKRLLIIFISACIGLVSFSQSPSWQNGYTVGLAYRQNILESAPAFMIMVNVTDPWTVANNLQIQSNSLQTPPSSNVLGYIPDMVGASGSILDYLQDLYVDVMLRNILEQMMNGMMTMQGPPDFNSLDYAAGFQFGLFGN